MPFVDATNEQATLIEDDDANSSEGNDGAAVINVQVPERDTNAQRSEVPLVDTPTSRRKGGKRKRTDSETARDQLISTMTKTLEEATRSEEAVENDISVYVNNMGRKLPLDKGREDVGHTLKIISLSNNNCLILYVYLLFNNYTLTHDTNAVNNYCLCVVIAVPIVAVN